MESEIPKVFVGAIERHLIKELKEKKNLSIIKIIRSYSSSYMAEQFIHKAQAFNIGEFDPETQTLHYIPSKEVI